MPYPFTCPNCRQTSHVLDNLAGMPAKCPNCGTVVAISPHPSADVSAAAVVAPLARGLAPTARTTSNPARNSSGALLAGLLVAGGGLLLFCCAGGTIGGYLLLLRPATVTTEMDGAQSRIDSDHSVAVPSEAPAHSAPTESSALPPGTRSSAPMPPSHEDEKHPPAYWVQVLRDADDSRAEKARIQLIRRGALAVPELRKALAEPEPRLRLAVVVIIGQIGDLATEAVPDVAQALTDPEASLRCAAAQSLGQMGKPARTSLAALVRALADPHPAVRDAVANALQQLGPPTKDDVPKLADLLKEPDVAKRAANAAALRSLRLDAETTVALFAALLKDPDKKIRVDAIRALGAAGKPARAAIHPQLLVMLDDPDADVRAAALAALPPLGPPAASERVALQQALRGQHAEMRRYAAESLGALGAKAAPSTPMLARALTDADASVRAAAAGALTRIGKPAAEVLDDVLNARTDSDPLVRKNVMELLCAIGRQRGVSEALFAALDDANETVRAAAFKALRALQPPPDKDDLLQLNTALKSPKLDVRRFAAAELARIGADSAPVLPTLVEALKDTDSEVQKNIYAALAALGPMAKSAAPHLLVETTTALSEAEKDPAAIARFRRASLTLAKIGETDQALPLLRRALKSKNETLRQETLSAIGLIGPAAKEAVPDLCGLLTEPSLRGTAADALAKIGKAAVPHLLTVLDKGPRDAKVGALRALGQMRPDDAKDAVTDVYTTARIYRGSEVGEAALATLAKINPPKKNN